MRRQLCSPDKPAWEAVSMAMSTADDKWDVNAGDRPNLEHYQNCILAGLRKGMPKQRSLNKAQKV